MRNWIDEKGRLFGKINVIDLGVVLLVLVIILGAFLFVFSDETGITAEEFSVRYTLRVSDVRDWTVNNIRVGDTVFSSGTEAGTIISMTTHPHETILSGNGKIWRTLVPDRYVIYVEIEATATISDGRYLISRTVPMAVSNSTTWLTTKFAGFGGTVKEIVRDE